MQVRRYDALASRTIRFEFVVSGETLFPLDMLRYEGAYPAASVDVVEITESICSNERDRHYRVTLVTTQSKRWLPTQERWKTFGWRVD